MDQIKKQDLLRYWRNSIADADKIGALIPQGAQLFSLEDYIQGVLPSSRIQYFFIKAEKKLRERNEKSLKYQKNPINSYEKKEDAARIHQLPVLIAPYTLVKKYEHGKKLDDGKKEKEIMPLWISADLTREGHLITNEPLQYPFIERRCLTPNFEEKIYPIIGDVADVDTFYEKNENTLSNKPVSWRALFTLAQNLLDALIKEDCFNFFEKLGYNLLSQGYIFPFNDMSGASCHIIKTYDQYLSEKNKKLPALLSQFCTVKSREHLPDQSETSLFLASQHHLGQMQNAYPLSPSQRMSLAYFFDAHNNDLFTIHGPPGTGKTDMLLSVISSLWVEKAIKKEPPPILVATSSNNLAITNILDRFESIGQDAKNPAVLRWLPQLKTYGLYLAAEKKGEIKYLYRTYMKDSEEIKNFYSVDYQEQAKIYFISQFNTYFNKTEIDLEECQHHLHQQLIEKKKILQNAIQTANDIFSAKKEIAAIYGNIEKLENYILIQQRNLAPLQKELEELRHFSSEWYLYKSNQLMWLQLFSWIPFIKIILTDKVRYFISKNHAMFDNIFGDLAENIKENLKKDLSTLTPILDKKTSELDSVVKKICQEIAGLIHSKENYLSFDDKKNTLQNKLGVSFNDEKDFLNILDTTLRYELFLLATHYWEAAWLINVGKFDLSSKYTQEGRRKFHEMQAMITPCLITTLYSGPAFFTYRTLSGQFERLSHFIDLLIIDESGQVMSAYAGAMISIAKRALFVGDTKQLQPIAKIMQSIDFANAKKFHLIQNKQDYEQLKTAGILCASDFSCDDAYGNIMLLAQRQAKYQLQNQHIPGMLLKEHRRCAKDIISYCNEMCYDNQLIPLADESSSTYPRMGYAHIKGCEEKQGGSRSNLLEAKVIVEWIVDNKEAILENSGKETLDESIGIVTPFAAQSKLIQELLKENNLIIEKVGTIHTLQGAEKPIVIFSPVYTAKESGKYFFDRSPNMLNVAVSRAKSSFLVFGDMDIFQVSRDSRPSSLLAKYLFSKEENEITNIKQPKWFSINRDELEQISTLERHREVLKNSFSEAQKELYIVSPYLTINAIESDNIIKLIETYAKTISIVIYTNPYLNKQRQKIFKDAVQQLIEAGAVVKFVKAHSKMITIDDRIIIEGSFNWLSSARAGWFKMQENSLKYSGADAHQLIEDALFPIKAGVQSMPQPNLVAEAN